MNPSNSHEEQPAEVVDDLMLYFQDDTSDGTGNSSNPNQPHYEEINNLLLDLKSNGLKPEVSSLSKDDFNRIKILYDRLPWTFRLKLKMSIFYDRIYLTSYYIEYTVLLNLKWPTLKCSSDYWYKYKSSNNPTEGDREPHYYCEAYQSKQLGCKAGLTFKLNNEQLTVMEFYRSY